MKFDIIGGILQLVGMFQYGLKPDKGKGNCFSVAEPCTVQKPLENLQTLKGNKPIVNRKSLNWAII